MTTQADGQLAHRSSASAPEGALRPELTPPSRKTVQLSPVPVERFADYSIVAKIGQGGMAEVFLAMTEGPSGFRKLLVLKKLHAHLNEEPEQVEMFLTEATLAARLHHPNIVQTNEVGHFEGRHYMAMEYLDGQPLDRVMTRLRKEESCLSLEMTVALACEALEGLHYAHEARDFDGAPLGIVHRDVSPHNLFVTHDGQVKLLDFGIAKTSALDSHTRNGVIRGKLSYIAPEQARCEQVDRRADVWSMGVTLWQCLSGQRLFQGETELAVLRAALRDEIPLLSDVANDIPEELATIVDRALRRDRERRYPTALELKLELESWLLTRPPLSLRPALSGLMNSLFNDQIEARKQLIAACFSQVARLEQGAMGSARPTRARDSSTRLEPATVPLPTTRNGRRRWGMAALASCGALAVALAVVSLDQPTAARPASSLGAGAVASLPARPLVAAPNSAGLAERAAARSQTPEPASAKAVPPASPQPAKSAQPSGWQRAAGSGSREIGAVRAHRHAQPAAASHETPAQPSSVPEPVVPVPSELEPKRGHLSLDTVPYSVVTLDGQRLGITPLEVELTAKTHTLTLRNPEHGVETHYQVTIKAGEKIERRIALE